MSSLHCFICLANGQPLQLWNSLTSASTGHTAKTLQARSCQPPSQLVSNGKELFKHTAYIQYIYIYIYNLKGTKRANQCKSRTKSLHVGTSNTKSFRMMFLRPRHGKDAPLAGVGQPHEHKPLPVPTAVRSAVGLQKFIKASSTRIPIDFVRRLWLEEPTRMRLPNNSASYAF